jgi:plastocyanin
MSRTRTGLGPATADYCVKARPERAQFKDMKTPRSLNTSIGLLLAISLPLTAEEHFVLVDSFGFSPATLQIVEGDTVTWVSDDEELFSHTITSTLPITNPEYWNNVVVSYGDMFSKTFSTTGTFDYFDQFDGNVGTVIVTPGTPPPPTLESPRVVGGQFLFNLSGLTVGNSHVIETSTNLTVWTALATNVATSTTMTATNPAASKARYFRVFELRLLSEAGQ